MISSLQQQSIRERYLKILLAYQVLPRKFVSRTLMEVAGFPRWENVCSNILAFYLDPREEHAMGDFLLQSFFALAKQANLEVEDYQSCFVYRESATSNRKRIDLLVTHPDFALVIENKIDHWLANDLDEYASAIKELPNASARRVKVVLSIHPIKEKLQADFVNITYRQLWQEVRCKLGACLHSSNSKWLTFLIDFIQHTENLITSMELQPTDHFFIEHDAIISTMIHDRDAFIKRLHSRVRELQIKIDEKEETKALKQKTWIFQNDCLVFDFCFNQRESFAFDMILKPSGWCLQLLARDKALGYLRQLAEVMIPGPKETTDNGRFVLQRWPLTHDVAALCQDLCQWIICAERSAKLFDSQ